jgi:hypothetical protein
MSFSNGIALPNTFAGESTPEMSQLDVNFDTLLNACNLALLANAQGNFIIPAPSGGDSLAITALANQSAIDVTSTGTGPYYALKAVTASGNSTYVHLEQTGIAIWNVTNVATSGNLTIDQNGTVYLTGTLNGNWTLAAPASGITLDVNAAGGTSTTGQGIVVGAGAGNWATISVCGNATTAGSNSLDIQQDNNGNGLIDLRANTNLKLATNATLAITISNTQTVTCAQGLGIYGNSPPAQVTGWGTPSGGSAQSNYSGSSATLAQTSAAVAQIIATLKLFGLFAA